MGSLTVSIDLQRRLGKRRTYTLIYRVCRVLGTVWNVYILQSTQTGWNAAFSPGCNCKLKFRCRLTHLLDFGILTSLIWLSLIRRSVILAKNRSTSNSPLRFLGGCMLMSAKGKNDKYRNLKIFDKMSQRIVFACSSMGRTWWLVCSALLAAPTPAYPDNMSAAQLWILYMFFEHIYD